MIPRIVEACRVTAGLVVVVMSGKVKHWRYQPVVEWLVADLTRYCGLVCGPSPYVFQRVGIPGSGNKHYHRRDWEPVYCFARPECLPLAWSDNTALGHPPKWAPGGEHADKLSPGEKVNQWGRHGTEYAQRRQGGERRRAARPSHIFVARGEGITGGKGERIKPRDFGRSKQMTRRRQGSGKRERQGKSGAVCGYVDGDTKQEGVYFPPVLANPGNVIRCKVGGNQMGDRLCHENEAPFPELLAEFFVRSYCPPWGRTLDCFCGSGTTIAVAAKWGRVGVGIDIRAGKGGIGTARRRLEAMSASRSS
jgi:hypothetical protein